MLGCLRMTVDECEEAYIRLAKTIFKPKRWKYNAFSRGIDFFSASERYDSSKLESVVKEIIKARTGSEKTPLNNFTEDGVGKVFVTTVQTDDNELLLLRSYETRQELDKHSKQFQLWEALRATSAATTYFKEYRRGNAGYLDGALKSNNPIFQVRQEARDQWPEREAFMISIGTGTKPSVPLRGNLIHLARTLTKLVTETEETWNRFRGSHKEMLRDNLLFRYSVPELGGVDLGNHKLMGMVRTNTERHLREAATEKYVTACAKKMVEIESGEYVKAHAEKTSSLRLEDLSDSEKDCLRSLHATSGDYESQRIGIEKPVPGTCQWFLRHPKFGDWVQSTSSSLLWVTANPGCGKSVLSSFLVDALSQDKNQSIVCSFFFKAGVDSRRHSHQALCVLLHQLFVAAPELVNVAMEDYSSKDKSSFTKDVEALWAVFRTSASRLHDRKIICVVDALDECSDESRNRFISQLVGSFSTSNSEKPAGNLRFLVTSRPWPSIESRFRNLLSIRLRGENESSSLSRDVERVVEHRVRELKMSSALSEDASTMVTKALTEGADRTFLWVSLVFDAIERLQSRKLSSIAKSLDSLPDDLDQLYESAWAAFVDREASRKLLGIILAAKSPLKLEEVNIALSSGVNITCLEGLEQELEPDAEYTIKQLGGFFIRIIDSTVFLVHHTAREFLLGSRADAARKEGKTRVQLAVAESDLGGSCVRFLALDGLPKRRSLPMEERERVESNKAFITDLPSWVRSFYMYASKYWTQHLGGNSLPESKSSIGLTVKTICDSSKPFFRGWWYFYAERDFFYAGNDARTMQGYVGRYHAHYTTMRQDFVATRGLLEAGTSSVEQRDANDNDILYKSCVDSNRPLCQLRWIFHQYNPAVLQLHKSLAAASKLGRMEAVNFLLATGMEIHPSVQGPPTRTWSLTQSAIHSTPALKCLLARGLIVQREDIAYAARHGYAEALEILLLHNAGERDSQETLREALVQATEKGYPRCRAVALKYLPDNAANEVDPSAGFLSAAMRSDESAVKEILDQGGQNSREALSFCCSLSYINMAKLFLESIVHTRKILEEALLAFYDTQMGTDLKTYYLNVVEKTAGSGRKLYDGFRYVSSFNGSFEQNVELLLLFSAKGVRLSRRRYVGAVALVIATDEKYSLWLLRTTERLQDDPKLSARDFLPIMCFWGKANLIQAVISGVALADINKRNKAGVTLLMIATASGDLATVGLLLERGADPDQECRLEAAQSDMTDCELELVDLLSSVAKGLDRGTLDGSPRSLAQEMGYTGIVNLLTSMSLPYLTGNESIPRNWEAPDPSSPSSTSAALHYGIRRPLLAQPHTLSSAFRPPLAPPRVYRSFHSTSPNMVVHNVRTAEEWKKTLESKTVVLLDCFATWCGPCKAIAPHLVRHSQNEKYKGIHFVKIDVDEVPDVSQELGIRAMPTFMIFKNKEKSQEIVGANPVALEKAIIELAATPEAEEAKVKVEAEEAKEAKAKEAASSAEEPKQE
ncbi:ankyrin repeat protein [Colletotrichum nymphaeae SA-01]|uniref:phospholipase A2 n=1 Tax=Colletotrichum nymphaeae SA-01 TaxID=1460502 RepID=A0A135SZR6_9PEZI|nr:ankyrin repeat protein [Colletotrichum nymphaeae SA-01]